MAGQLTLAHEKADPPMHCADLVLHLGWHIQCAEQVRQNIGKDARLNVITKRQELKLMEARIRALKLSLALITGNACIAQPGDTLAEVATRVMPEAERQSVGINAKVRELARLNGIANPDLVRPGEVLITADLTQNGRARTPHH